MLIVPSRQKEKLDALMQEIVAGFNASKIDAIAQVKNVTAVVVRTAAPTIPPPQTWRLRIDSVASKAYISTWTTFVSDWSFLWTIAGSVASGKVAIGWSWWALTSFTTLSFNDTTWVFWVPIVDVTTEYRVWGTKVVWSRQAAIADAVGWDEVVKINAILAMLRVHWLISP